ncbi:MAG TPA: YdeI/OmpD-associated family protein [Alloacidobacterium sp.]|nr:YdeI/OmpD-associated family protein [Alloacidobacterium sp.]
MPEKSRAELPIIAFASQKEWAKWLKTNHLTSQGLWMQLAKKASGSPSVTYAEAIETALCYGWIDGQKQSHSAEAWLQKFTPRGRRSIWSKINREKAVALIEGGKMKPRGLAEVERAKQDGRWEQAYDSPGSATVPADLQTALNKSPKAKAFFATLESRNRYAILWRIQTAKKAATRAKRIDLFIKMLEKGERIHP